MVVSVFVRRWRYYLAAVFLLAGGMLLWLPTPYYRILEEGSDTYATHHALYGPRHKFQDFTFAGDVQGAGALLVDLRKKDVRAPVEVVAYDAHGHELARGVSRADELRDDAFLWIPFSTVITARDTQLRFDWSAPQAASEAPVGLRFNGEDGHLAMGVIERVPAWKQLLYWRQAHPNAAARLMYSFVGGGLGAFFFFLSLSRHASGPRAWWLALTILGVCALLVRLPLLMRVESVFGGDAYNYILKSMAWIQGYDPFVADVRKAPLFSLLLLPGLLSSDPVLWARFLSVAAAVAATMALPWLLRGLGVPAVFALGSGVLLAVNRDFRWESVHGLATILYAFLIIGAVVAYVYARSARGAYMVGLMSGLATLTRYEGGLVAAILIPAVWMRSAWRRPFLVKALLPALILMAIPFTIWPFSGQVGVRLFSDIAADGGLSVAWSLDDFIQNTKGFKAFWGRVWFFTSGLGKQLQAFVFGGGIGLLVWCIERFRVRVPMICGYIFLIIFSAAWLAILLRDSGQALEHLTLWCGVLMGVGTLYALMRWPRVTIPIFLVVMMQIFLVTLLLPKPRYYVQVVPFMATALVLGIFALSSLYRSRVSHAAALVLLGMVAGLVYFDGNDALGGTISDYNEKSQVNTVMLNAARFLRGLDGNVALATDDLSMRVMLTDSRLDVFPSDVSVPVSAQAQLEWLARHRPAYVVESSSQPLFSVVHERPDIFEEVAVFTTRFGLASASVFRIRAELQGL